ncbi:hypothetical protein ACHAQH_007501 [Verticillium albo-atrum]
MYQERTESVRNSNTDAASTRARNGSPESRYSNPDRQPHFVYHDDHYNADRHDKGRTPRVDTDSSPSNGSRHSTPLETTGIWLPDMDLGPYPATPQHTGGKRSPDKLERELDHQLEQARGEGPSKRVRRDSERSVFDSVGLEDPSSPGTGTDGNDSNGQTRRRRAEEGRRKSSRRDSNGGRR